MDFARLVSVAVLPYPDKLAGWPNRPGRQSGGEA